MTLERRIERLLGTSLRRIRQWPGHLQRLLLLCTALLCVVVLAGVISAPASLSQQFLLGLALVIAALVLRRFGGRLPIIAMISLSLIASLRYMYWRLSETLELESFHDTLFGYTLVVAELYALVVLVFGYVQTAWPLKRRPILLEQAPEDWPSVDVFITTVNESLEIVKITVFAAQGLDWPEDKLRVHVLDDGRREDFRAFCESVGVHYLTRDNNLHAKAGNFNAALKVTHGEYIAAFDADHVPSRSFLQISMGWFLKDPKLAMLQTPHCFFSPDPFEKNLDTWHSVPNEGELFYGLVQDGNDLWNAAMFCGSCALMRRAPLQAIGGMDETTLTEDAHTSLKLNRAGYNTAYLALPQAAGMATENLARHINQRVRWARGMTQIFRTDNPMLGRGLTLGQRVCYTNAMLHFFYGFPRMVFLTAPLAYLIFGAQIFHAAPLMVAAYAFPHLLLANLTNSRIQGRFRHSYWNEVYETVLAWYILPPVLKAMINPRSGHFNVTDKGGDLHPEFFDWKMARPYIVLLLLNITGVLFGLYDYIGADDTTDITVLLNQIWAMYNVMVTSAALAVASESRQIRSEPRVEAQLPVSLQLADGRVLQGTTEDFSQHGLGLSLGEGLSIPRGERLRVSLFRHGQHYDFDGTVVSSQGSNIGIQFEPMTLHQQSDLVHLTFARADTWAMNWGTGKPDSPLAALREVSVIGLHGIGELLKATVRLFPTLPARRRASSTSALDTP
ncbi:UDP-forming cellulose synthase catalytic subunit [Pseudomonas asplenii]|uniref:Cellulose synthase catalytic subunit [UDP-forming] n=1 Tax=Pseudomonas asplenii TaxID=53407 RepID=A0A1H6M992_9PSED|nr:MULTISPECIES: UDP-forming cellulose synthase catalytic subunit [Pseudomonas]UZE28884.1 UDP-forming cellulose synthase catalytic subunit [Pseudomonas asplenii]SEH95462.1 cellulose synthase (UDP-forming) [Pseudomonas fuscovaginae]